MLLTHTHTTQFAPPHTHTHTFLPTQLLEAKCRNTEQCLAFNTVGEIKSHVQPKATWINITGEGGLYVADINVCAADLHDCPVEAHCHKTGNRNTEHNLDTTILYRWL